IVTPEDSLSVCENANAQLKATSNVNPVQFNWNGPDGFTSGVKDPVVENVDSSKAGKYIVVATDGKCFSQPAYLYLEIKRMPPKPSLLSGIDTSVCEGAYIKLKMLPVAGATYSWTGPDNFRSILLEPVIPKATTADSGIYYAHYIINSCMSFPATFKLKIYANPVASFTQNTNSGDRPLQVMFFNSSINAERYLWNFGDTSFSDIISPLHIYNNTGNYTVKLIAYNHAGCADSATSALIHVKDIANLYIPNSFSPNQDGLNDIFRVKGFDIVWLNAYIYNRWGNLIYEWHDINGGWDGRYKGEIAPAGIYVYVIDCLGTNKEKHHYNGTITLIR
ncbi:MAG: gliding motility-associated C-terminal domain-containing protein, partial [Bacteroidota bacterium]|nr:gliding motility-associated C-terminal domain-containing protein [Bacteroidota bacterium]